MKRVAPALQEDFVRNLVASSVPPAKTADYLKWLRFYLDFCDKYRHPPRDRDSLEPFLQKLASKNQSRARQEEAAHSVAIFYGLFGNHGRDDTSPQHGDRLRSAQPMSNPPSQWRIGKSVKEVIDQRPEPKADALKWDACYRKLKEIIKVRQYSPKTLATYRIWTEQFQRFLRDKPPGDVTADDAARYLTHLATEQRVVASTQNQAFNALLFLFRHVLDKDYDLKDKVVRARRTRYIPVVLTRDEVNRVVAELEYPYTLVVGMLYGCGLRLFEALNLRVGCLNFDDMIVTVHDGKGKKDRTVPLPETLLADLQVHIKRVYALHAKDVGNDYDGVFMPGATDRKWKNASKDLVWQWVFPAKTLTFVPDKKEHRRYHLHESVFQKALRAGVRKAQIPKRVTAHTFRHSFASHLLRNNYDIRTIQEMLGHSDVRTTMIYTHTVKSRTQKERKSPLDF